MLPCFPLTSATGSSLAPARSSPKTSPNPASMSATPRAFCGPSLPNPNLNPSCFMKIPFVDLHAQYLTIKPQIDAAIADVIAQSAYIRGPQVDAFEQAWAR